MVHFPRTPQINLKRFGQSLQGRFLLLTALLVAAAVAVVSLSVYLFTSRSLLRQLDSELISVASYISGPIASDLEGLGGLNAAALNAANVSLALVKADGGVTHIVGERITIDPGPPELAIARTQLGWSARNIVASDDSLQRVVAVPMTVQNDNYALVLARPTEPMSITLTSLQRMVTTISILFVAVAAAMGYISARALVRPLRELAAAVAYVTETDELVPIGNHSDNELGELSRSFDTMINSLEVSRDRQKRLIADAGHELRTPLTSMRTNIELLVADEKTDMLPPGARAEILTDVAAQLGEFTSLVADLVQLSREDDTKIARELLDFSTVVRNAVDRAHRRGPQLLFDVALERYYVVGEPDTLERAVTNLLDNAVKFSPEGGTVHVKLEDEVLTVDDEGPGIADQDINHIFDRFYRSDKARNTPGTGLELSIVAHTVNSHGGWVAAGHAPTGGARFTLRLPPAPPEALEGVVLEDLP